MVIVKKDYLSFLKRPISQKLFGENKTYRGFVVMIGLSILGVELSSFLFSSYFPSYFSQRGFLGFLLGLGYALFELPNSYVKRKLGIVPGELGNQNFLRNVTQATIDQADSSLGCTLGYWIYYGNDKSLSFYGGLFLVGTLFHLFFNVLLFFLKLRKNPL